MIKEDNNILILYLVLIIVVITKIFIVPSYFTGYSEIINLILWIITFLISFLIVDKYTVTRNKKEKIKTILIITFVYYIIYSLLGLLLGYQKNPYSFELNTISKNLFTILGVSLLQEFVRTKLVQNTKSIYNITIIIIIFAIINIDFVNINVHFINIETMFQYFVSVVLVEIIRSILLTYLSKIGGVLLNYAYKIPITLSIFLLPVFPNIDWFFESSLQMILAIIIFLFINYEHILHKDKKRRVKNITPITTIPTLIIALIFVGFVSGFFHIIHLQLFQTV